MGMTRAVLIAVLLLPALAQEAPEKDAVTPSAEALRHVVRLRSGTALVGTLEPVEWRIKTAFGELKIPVGEIASVRFGRRSQPERLDAIESAIGDLGSTNAERRDHARAALVETGAFGALSLARAMKDHEDPEVRRLCKEVLEALDLEESAYVKDDDVIETTKFNLTGTIDLRAFKVNVPELGALPVRRGDIVRIHLFKADRPKAYAVSGTNIWPNGWLDTKITFKKGERVEISAEGTIHFPNWGNQMFTPDGSPHMGNIAGMGIGTLAGRFGKSGAPFRVGSSYSGKANASGTLRLVVILNVHGQVTNGEYDVTVRRGDED